MQGMKKRDRLAPDKCIVPNHTTHSIPIMQVQKPSNNFTITPWFRR